MLGPGAGPPARFSHVGALYVFGGAANTEINDLWRIAIP